ncbi:MAG TPA: hypothetical protein ENK01_03695 [Hellea balneolensis]|uniref:DUF2730 family protein n=1 Tax=Hellea balneolensis TaxID=287478 RepID=A0A7V5U1G1_9PROT|nr:hypothetical protein [Hellea balneolensis]
MVDEPENVVLRYLRRIDKNVSEMREDVMDLKVRMPAIERNFGEVQVQIGGLNSRVDRVETRLSRIERRLDLYDNAMMERTQEIFEGRDD